MDETGAPTGNADGGNPNRKRGWQWVMVTPVVTVFLQGLSRSAAGAMERLGSAFAGVVVSDRFSVYNNLPLEQRQLCWAHLIRDLIAITGRPGASGEIGAQVAGDAVAAVRAVAPVEERNDRLAPEAAGLPADPSLIRDHAAASGASGF